MCTGNTEFILVLFFINHCIIFEMNNCKSTFVPPFVCNINMMNNYSEDRNEISWWCIVLFFTPLVTVFSIEIDYLEKFNFILGKFECWVVYRHCRFSELEDWSFTSSYVISWLADSHWGHYASFSTYVRVLSCPYNLKWFCWRKCRQL